MSLQARLARRDRVAVGEDLQALVVDPKTDASLEVLLTGDPHRLDEIGPTPPATSCCLACRGAALTAIEATFGVNARFTYVTTRPAV